MTCEEVFDKTYTSDHIRGSKATNEPFVVTRSVVTSTMDMGVDHSGLVKFCHYLDTPMMNKTTYTTCSKLITAASMVVANNVLCESAQIVRKVYHDSDPSIDESGVIDLAVSFDGSWMKRGHTSPYGVGCAIEVVTGLIVDFVVMSLYCQSCSYATTHYGGRDMSEFEEWYRAHTDCNCNSQGTSGGMEVEAAEKLWKRSVKHHFR